MIKNNPQDFQPQDDRFWGIYRGVVEDNVDPEEMGRCKVRIFGKHTHIKNKNEIEGITTDDLPWAEPALGLFEGSVTGFGSWTVPLQGSHVFLFFENGHPLNPRFFASAPGKPTDINHGFGDSDGFSDPDSEYPNEETEAPHKPNQLNEPDWHRLARNEGTDETIVKHKNDGKDTGISTASGDSWDEPDSYYSSQYPNNKVFATHSGITIEIDDTEGEERIHVYHPSKSYIEIDKDGNVVIRNANDKFEIVDNNKKQHIMNNLDRTVDSNRTSKVGEDQEEEIGGDSNINTGGETVNTSSDDSTLNGANVNLNKDKGSVHSIVTTGHICAITGLPHPCGSPTCFAHLDSETDPGKTN